MTTGIVVLGADDAARLAALHAAAFTDPWSAASLADQLHDAATTGLGIEDADGVSGFILIQRVGDTADILTIATHPAKQRRGIARRLLNAAEQAMRARGVVRVLLDVADDNTAARAFYASAGFAVDGRRKGYFVRLDGPRTDAVLMSKSLGI